MAKFTYDQPTYGLLQADLQYQQNRISKQNADTNARSAGATALYQQEMAAVANRNAQTGSNAVNVQQQQVNQTGQYQQGLLSNQQTQLSNNAQYQQGVLSNQNTANLLQAAQIDMMNKQYSQRSAIDQQQANTAQQNANTNTALANATLQAQQPQIALGQQKAMYMQQAADAYQKGDMEGWMNNFIMADPEKASAVQASQAKIQAQMMQGAKNEAETEKTRVKIMSSKLNMIRPLVNKLLNLPPNQLQSALADYAPMLQQLGIDPSNLNHEGLVALATMSMGSTTNQKLTAEASKQLALADYANQSIDEMAQFAKDGASPTSASWLPNRMQSDITQKFAYAQKNVAQAFSRMLSGAAMSDKEKEVFIDQYTIQPGDSEDTINYKIKSAKAYVNQYAEKLLNQQTIPDDNKSTNDSLGPFGAL